MLCSKQGGIRQQCTVCPRNSSYYKLAQPNCGNAQIVEAAGQSWQQSFTRFCISWGRSWAVNRLCLRKCGVRKSSYGGPVPGWPSIINEGWRQPGGWGWAGQGSVLTTSFIQLLLNEVFISVLCWKKASANEWKDSGKPSYQALIPIWCQFLLFPFAIHCV